MMIVATFLRQATQQLTEAGIETARLDCLILLEDELGKDRARLLAHPELQIRAAHLQSLQSQLARRAQHIPLAYIRGKAAFYGREFIIIPDVLVPRPETEDLIELLKELQLEPPEHVPLYIADVGTGSGCLGITAGLELPGSVLDFYDIDDQALATTRKNAQRFNLKIHVDRQNLLEKPLQTLPRPYDVVLANLPYVPIGHQINQAAAHEPKLALFGGKEGLDLYGAFWRQLRAFAQKPYYIITESFPFQHHQNARLAERAGYQLQKSQGFAQRFALIERC